MIFPSLENLAVIIELLIGLIFSIVSPGIGRPKEREGDKGTVAQSECTRLLSKFTVLHGCSL